MKPKKFRVWAAGEMHYPTIISFDASGASFASASGGGGSFRVALGDVMEFTGLCDKNGQEVYEGDVVELDDGDGWVLETAPVVFINGAFQTKETNCHDLVQPELSKVVGNIHEHPHLLEPQ